MKIETQAQGQVAVLTPHGPLVAAELESFRQQLQPALKQRGGRVVLDLRDVPYVDSGGIETLLELCGDRRAGTVRPKLAAVGDTCREALDLTNCLPRFEVFDTVENAVRSLRR